MQVTHPYDRLPEAATELFGEEATAGHSYDLLTVDVPAASWLAALETARDRLGCTYFDWLSAVDEPDTGFRVCAHVVALEGRTVRRLLVRTTVPHTAPVLPSAVAVYAGASWHERETHEMFGVTFTDHPHLVPLLLPEGFEGHPLRKDFVLAARVVKAWPGAKEPGESTAGHGAGAGGAKRRQMLPPGVPDPNEWGPQKGQLPPAPARPARAARAAGDRPARRARSVNEGSTSQSPATAGNGEPQAQAPTAQGPADSPTPGQVQAGGTAPATAAETPASSPGTPAGRTPAGRTPAGPRRSRSVSEGSTSQRAAEPTPPAAPPAPAGSDDAPWRNARPAFEPPQGPATGEEPSGAPATEASAAEGGSTEDGSTTEKAPEREPETEPEPETERETEPEPEPERETGPEPAAEPETAPKPETAPGTDPNTRPDPRPDTPRPDTPAGGDTA
ncbi:NADH-quinone oxidoreductase subunit C [Streptomyces sp. NBC_00932]|uniref:NADH-quinone oxidoreductase subunit C n=1 Tax=Streptomyces sp. NBC_00932 TaxID=2903690 RepID=UPI003863DC2A|nr:NADH-quinone oxidoreductase subunit C [Streptomyces sp. NBC_00932]